MQVFKQSAPGVSKHVKKTLHHDNFKDVLKSKSPLRNLITSVASDNHTLIITESNKIALSAFDDKRYYLSDGLRSYAHGYYIIGQKQKETREKALESYIKMNESEAISNLNEKPDSEIDETYAPPDPGFWQTSQIISDDK